MAADAVEETTPAAPAVPPCPKGGAGAAAAVWRQSGATVALALYLLAAALLAIRLGDHPPFPYNWEDYSAWHVFDLWRGPGVDAARVLGLSDGLMTDSGQGPLVGLPVALGFALGGIGLVPMRLPVALLSAAAVPLCWLVGRRLAGGGVALLAALLLALSPVFLLYGRTATIVGVSLVPALLTVLALLRVLDGRADRAGWAWLVALQLALIGGEYAYATVRLLWPLALALLAAGAVARRGRRRWLLGALALSAIALPLALVAIGGATGSGSDPWGDVAAYFRARGEQVLALREAPEGYGYYLRPSAEEEAGGVRESPDALALRLVGQNAGDLARLLADRDTLPTLTDHWNARGRLWPGLFAPFFVAGLLATLWRAVVGRKLEAMALALLAGGLTLPLLLTSRVHVGRLVPALPVLLLLVAIGATAVGGWLARAAGLAWSAAEPGSQWTGLTARSRPQPAEDGRGASAAGAVPSPGTWAVAGVAALVAAAGAASAWAEVGVTIPPTREASAAATLRALATEVGSGGAVALIEDPALGAEVERVRAANLRLQLDAAYRFVDLAGPSAPPAGGDPRPALWFDGVLGRLKDGSLPEPCRPLYLVTPEVESAFRRVAERAATAARCAASLRSRSLPP